MSWLRIVMLAALAGLVGTSGCVDGSGDADGDGDSDGDGEGLSVDLEGAVQKGPFMVGSSIEVSVLDRDLDPTGFVYSSETINDRGEFEIGFRASGPVSLEGNGYYYNEVTAELSASTLTLRALYMPPGSGVQSACINMVTHLTTHRIRALVSDGERFVTAVDRAERELISELEITPPGFSPGAAGVEMNLLGGDTDANATLLAVSAVLIQVAVDRGEPVEANLQEVLNTASLDLADGVLSPDLVAEVGDSLLRLDPWVVEGHLAARFVEIGASEAVPDMDRVIDQDRDGLANAEDNCPLEVPSECAPEGSYRGRCHEDSTCDAGLVCASSEELIPCLSRRSACCMPAGGDGDLCYEDSTCDPGFGCVRASRWYDDCPSDRFTCCRPAGGDMELCYEDSTCDAGLRCVMSSEAPGSCYSETTCCLPVGGNGELCYEDFTCDEGLGCATSSLIPSLCGQTGERCVPAGHDGLPCYCDWTCDEGFACLVVDDLCHTCGPHVPSCRAAGGHGEPCLPDEVCNEGLFCVRHFRINAESDFEFYDACDPAGGLDQACRPGHVCDEGLVCVDNPDFGPTEICRPE
jgi:hypothetical protein